MVTSDCSTDGGGGWNTVAGVGAPVQDGNEGKAVHDDG